MPIDWKAAESAQRLLAVVMIAHNIKRPDYRRMATLYGNDATYDSIESRFRPIRTLMKQIMQELEDRGIDLVALPRGRGQGTASVVKPSPKESDVKQENSGKKSSVRVVATGSMSSSSRKRTAKPANPKGRKKVKQETNEKDVIDLCGSDTDLVDNSDDDEDPIRISGRRSKAVAPKERPLPQPVVLIKKSDPNEYAGVPTFYDTTCDSSSASDDDNHVGPRYETEDESDDPPLPPGRRTRPQPALNTQYGPGSSFDGHREFWRSIGGSDAQSASFASSSPLPSSPTVVRRTALPPHATAGRPFAPKLNSINYDSKASSFSSLPPTEKLYREPDTYAYTSTTTSMSNENAPFLPQRTASRSSSSHPTRFSPVAAYRPTSKDLEAPEDMIPSNFMRGLDITTDDTSMPWSPELTTAATSRQGGPSRLDRLSAQRGSSKSTTSKSGSGNSNAEIRSPTIFSNSERNQYMSHNTTTNHPHANIKPQRKQKIFNPPSWSSAAPKHQSTSSASGSNTSAKTRPLQPTVIPTARSVAKMGGGKQKVKEEEADDDDLYEHYRQVSRVSKEDNPMGLLFPKTIHYA